MMKNNKIDYIRYQLMWNRLISIVEEQAVTLIRTAFSTSVREAGDLSAGVFDAQGKMLAQAVTGTPGHVNAMAAAVQNFIKAIGQDGIFENDVYITNDPWQGTGHLHDFTLVSPSFYKKRLIGYFACTAHVNDVGGRGFGPDANEVYEEGIFIPIMKFAEKGVINRVLIDILRHNVRQSEQVIGDLYSLAACNETGHRRIIDMMKEFKLTELNGLRDFIFENSRTATLNKLARLPEGSYENQMTVDGYDEPICLKLRLDISKKSIHADFAGSSAQSSFGINVPIIYTKAYCCYALKCALAPEIPNNYASLSPFSVSATPGSILHALHPAAVSVRHVLGHFIPDTVFGALCKILPSSIPAEGASALWNIQIAVRPSAVFDSTSVPRGQSAEILMFNSGGTGARSELDGLNATAFPSGVESMSVEASEQTAAIIVWRKELRVDSAGLGKQRGGLGQIIEIAAGDGHKISFNAMFDRIKHAARGRAGGRSGALGKIYLSDGTLLNAMGRQIVPAGLRVIFELPGGGGFGPIEERSSSDTARDIRLGYISHSSSSS